jgi:hypothetical protein
MEQPGHGTLSHFRIVLLSRQGIVISVQFRKICSSFGHPTSKLIFSPDGASLLVFDSDEVVDEGWG